MTSNPTYGALGRRVFFEKEARAIVRKELPGRKFVEHNDMYYAEWKTGEIEYGPYATPHDLVIDVLKGVGKDPSTYGMEKK
jgi:hypothetical protein